VADETTGELGFFETIGRVLWHPRAFFNGPHPFKSKVPAVVVWAIAHGLTGLASAGMFGALPWPDSPRSIFYLFGAATGALMAGAAVSVPFL
jgi:hypothetical protein